MLLRHGRTAWNAIGRGQGHADVELDDLGHAQAAVAGPWVARHAPAALWSSDLARARQTAAYVEKATGLVATLDPRLREFDLGERTGLTMPEFAEQFPEQHDAWHRGVHDAVPGAESTEQVHRRIVPALRELVASVDGGETALAVTHGAALRVALVALLGWPEELGRSLRGMGNCAAAVLETAGDDRPLRLWAWNATPDFASAGAVE